MRDLIMDNSSLLMVMSRFGIPLGFGDKSVETICAEQGVDVGTFLSVANFISRRGWDVRNVSLQSLTDYLRQAHDYFLEFNLPAIRRKLIDAIDCSGTDEVALLILKFYDEYVTEVRRHMGYEDATVFSYVAQLLQGRLASDYTIATFVSMHNHIEERLSELKSIIIRYYPQKNNHLLNSVLFDIINCEQDLMSHCAVEDDILVPAVERLERELQARSEQGDVPSDEILVDGDKMEMLSEREKDIIRCVTKGMTNKEIADSLCLSVHTVTTHRRNISSKLQIHTPAGLTIYAIVNGIVSLNEV
ncbi:MAG: helix-turn-helix transcriptional regulator [Alistipes sp.]|nr:helix-turn-helix transcriptional regulator [Alistipes sp.]